MTRHYLLQKTNRTNQLSMIYLQGCIEISLLCVGSGLECYTRTFLRMRAALLKHFDWSEWDIDHSRPPFRHFLRCFHPHHSILCISQFYFRDPQLCLSFQFHQRPFTQYPGLFFKLALSLRCCLCCCVL